MSIIPSYPTVYPTVQPSVSGRIYTATTSSYPGVWFVRAGQALTVWATELDALRFAQKSGGPCEVIYRKFGEGVPL